jgi:hypothetical protein
MTQSNADKWIKDQQEEENVDIQVLNDQSGGKLTYHTQFEDYCMRSDSLEEMNIIKMFRDTCEAYITVKDTDKRNTQVPSVWGRGRHPNDRHFYKQMHLFSEKYLRIMRQSDHTNLVNIIGPQLP